MFQSGGPSRYCPTCFPFAPTTVALLPLTSSKSATTLTLDITILLYLFSIERTDLLFLAQLAFPTNSHLSASALKSVRLTPVIKTGLISQANGSAYIESGGKVKIACAVYGPRPKPPPFTPKGGLNLEVKFAPFASDPRRAPLRVSVTVVSTFFSIVAGPLVLSSLVAKSRGLV